MSDASTQALNDKTVLPRARQQKESPLEQENSGCFGCLWSKQEEDTGVSVHVDPHESPGMLDSFLAYFFSS